MEELLKEYVEKNNIKSYLKYDDIAGILSYISNLHIKNTKKYIEILIENTEVDETLEDTLHKYIATYNYTLAVINEDIGELLEYIYGCEFDVEINKEGKLDLIDCQNAYLGGVDSYENFETISDISERLEGSYYNDYYGIN